MTEQEQVVKNKEARDISILVKVDLIEQHLLFDPTNIRIKQLLEDIRKLIAPL